MPPSTSNAAPKTKPAAGSKANPPVPARKPAAPKATIPARGWPDERIAARAGDMIGGLDALTLTVLAALCTAPLTTAEVERDFDAPVDHGSAAEHLQAMERLGLVAPAKKNQWGATARGRQVWTLARELAGAAVEGE